MQRKKISIDRDYTHLRVSLVSPNYESRTTTVCSLVYFRTIVGHRIPQRRSCRALRELAFSSSTRDRSALGIARARGSENRNLLLRVLQLCETRPADNQWRSISPNFLAFYTSTKQPPEIEDQFRPDPTTIGRFRLRFARK